MTDENTVIDSEIEVKESKEVKKEEPEFITNKDLNSALNKRLKAMEESILSKLNPIKEEKKEPEKVSNTELVEMRDVIKQMREEKKALISKSRETHLQSTVKEELGKLGIEPKFYKAAMALLVSEGLIGFSEDTSDDDMAPEIVFKSVEGPLSVSSGLKNYWLKSDDSQGFLSASNVKGSGDKNYKSNKPTNKPKPGDIGKALLKQITGR